ncbi:MAG: amidohydrolase [Betaproteobacteria bacterium]|nr:amidohydrolase [Betaproteobacteria bacterium]
MNAPEKVSQSILEHIEQQHEEMTVWRRDIHANPELGFEETRTSDLVARRLESWGIEVHRGIGKTGLVGVLKVGDSNRSIGLRADMDALPVLELNQFAHCSRRKGLMHACGHDGHTTMLLGAAKYLAASKRFDGTVHFIFQPAEEGLGGALAMINEGLFERFPCDSIFGMHNRPKLPVGHFNVKAGPMMASAASWDIHIQGYGSHGARPESSVDPILIGAQIVSNLQAIVSRNVRPVETAGPGRFETQHPCERPGVLPLPLQSRHHRHWHPGEYCPAMCHACCNEHGYGLSGSCRSRLQLVPRRRQAPHQYAGVRSLAAP